MSEKIDRRRVEERLVPQNEETNQRIRRSEMDNDLKELMDELSELSKYRNVSSKYLAKILEKYPKRFFITVRRIDDEKTSMPHIAFYIALIENNEETESRSEPEYD